MVSAKTQGNQSNCVIEQIVPGPKGLLKVGYDDNEIQRIACENLLDLEDDADNKNSIHETYVVTVETLMKKLSPDPDKPVLQYRPFRVIYARNMFEAIEYFEEESGKRVWMPDGDRNIAQFGLPRISSNTHFHQGLMMIHLERMRKDCIINKEKA